MLENVGNFHKDARKQAVLTHSVSCYFHIFIFGFTVLDDNDIEQLDEQSKQELLIAKYRCLESAECIFKIELINSNGEFVYEDEQILEGDLSIGKMKDRGIKRIFKKLIKLDYQYTPQNNKGYYGLNGFF